MHLRIDCADLQTGQRCTGVAVEHQAAGADARGLELRKGIAGIQRDGAADDRTQCHRASRQNRRCGCQQRCTQRDRLRAGVDTARREVAGHVQADAAVVGDERGGVQVAPGGQTQLARAGALRAERAGGQHVGRAVAGVAGDAALGREQRGGGFECIALGVEVAAGSCQRQCVGGAHRALVEADVAQGRAGTQGDVANAGAGVGVEAGIEVAADAAAAVIARRQRDVVGSEHGASADVVGSGERCIATDAQRTLRADVADAGADGGDTEVAGDGEQRVAVEQHIAPGRGREVASNVQFGHGGEGDAGERLADHVDVAPGRHAHIATDRYQTGQVHVARAVGDERGRLQRVATEGTEGGRRTGTVDARRTCRGLIGEDGVVAVQRHLGGLDHLGLDVVGAELGPVVKDVVAVAHPLVVQRRARVVHILQLRRPVAGLVAEGFGNVVVVPDAAVDGDVAPVPGVAVGVVIEVIPDAALLRDDHRGDPFVAAGRFACAPVGIF